MKRYIYIEYLGVENGVKMHLVYDRITKKETVVNHLEMMNDGNDFDWTSTFAKMKRRD
jgi:hypothetical protein